MKNIITGALAALFMFTNLGAAELVKPNLSLKLYPEGQGVDKGIVENGKQITMGPLMSNGIEGKFTVSESGSISNMNDPYMDIYLPEKGNGQMIVVCPGGGYSHLSSYNEGTRVADWCIRHDIAVCVIHYRIPNGHHKVPLWDVQNAFRYCRAHSAEWGIRQIGVMGFSAGGHLAASASTLYVDDITRPDFSVLVYPVISLDEFVTHEGTRVNLIGQRAGKDMVEHYSLDNNVNRNTPPAILLLSADDNAVPPENSIRYFRAMQASGVSGELHIFTSGGHGWGFTTIENSGRDALGGQRQYFFDILERWLKAQNR